MFQTEINHFFQSFASDGLTAFMRLITALGYMEFFLVFLIILLFAIHFKKAFLLFMVLLWTGAITFFFKDYFDLPRPFHVDNTLQYLDGQLGDKATFDFSKMGAKIFWSGLPPEVLEVTRKIEGVENGFPSGHSSIAIAFWATLALLFKKRWLTILSIVLMVLIPLSRIYLGVHFLADVLGGMALGGVILAIFYAIILNPKKLNVYLQKDIYPLEFNKMLVALLISPIPLLFILPHKVYVVIALLFGLGLGFLLLAKKGLPNSAGTIPQRIGRTIIGAFAFIGVGFLMKLIAQSIGLGDNIWFEFFGNVLAGLALIWLSTEISIRLGLFERGNFLVKRNINN